MRDLASRQCVPCRSGIPPMHGAKIKEYLDELNGWEAVDEHHLIKRFEFKNFLEAQTFIMQVGTLAEEQGHHPDICFGWGYAEVKIWTHKIGGLSEGDFILAAKIDAM